MTDKSKNYVPYTYKSEGTIIIDSKTGCATSFNPKVKGDGMKAKSR